MGGAATFLTAGPGPVEYDLHFARTDRLAVSHHQESVAVGSNAVVLVTASCGIVRLGEHDPCLAGAKLWLAGVFRAARGIRADDEW